MIKVFRGFMIYRLIFSLSLLLVCYCNETFSQEIDDNTNYELSVCAIFQNDARFLKEWIEYHRLVGVEHFWLYNNYSTDNYLEVLEPYISSGVVELNDWYNLPNEKFENGSQPRAYTDAIARTRGKTDWLAVIDTDEFLLPLEKDNLVDVLRECSSAGIICFWLCFGDSGVFQINEMMIEELTSCAKKSHRMHKWGKTIFRPDCAYSFDNAHYPKFFKGYKITNGRGQIRINHYWSRDTAFFLQSKVDREKFFGANRQECLQRNADYNLEKNTDILRFVPELKKRMGL